MLCILYPHLYVPQHRHVPLPLVLPQILACTSSPGWIQPLSLSELTQEPLEKTLLDRQWLTPQRLSSSTLTEQYTLWSAASSIPAISSPHFYLSPHHSTFATLSDRRKPPTFLAKVSRATRQTPKPPPYKLTST